MQTKKIGRNEPCPCGSGKKYKQCCLRNKTVNRDLLWRRLRECEDELEQKLLEYGIQHYGKEAIYEAWDEFTIWTNVPINPDEYPEIESMFDSWFLYNWVPDNAERPQSEHFPEISIGKHYLHYHGSRLSPLEQQFIRTACTAPFSFYRVQDAIPGRSLTLRNCLTDEQVTVLERQASATLTRNKLIFARVISHDDIALMLGCSPYPLNPDQQLRVIDFRDKISEVYGPWSTNMLCDYDIELRELYFELRNALLHPKLPQLTNTEGDPIELTTLHYRLHCTPQEAFEALQDLALGETEEALLADAIYDDQNRLKTAHIPWIKLGNTKIKSWDNTLLGNLKIEGEQLSIEINSRKRAKDIRNEITQSLGEKAEYRRSVIQSPEKLMKDRLKEGKQPTPPPSLEDLPPELQEQIKAYGRQYWLDWLDVSLPALNGETPRQASRNKIGRERLEILMRDFGHKSSLSSQAMGPDVDWLRQQLNLSSEESD